MILNEFIFSRFKHWFGYTQIFCISFPFVLHTSNSYLVGRCLVLPCRSIHSSAAVRPTVRDFDGWYDIHRLVDAGGLSIEQPGERCWRFGRTGAVEEHEISSMYGFRSCDGHVFWSIWETKSEFLNELSV